MDVGVPDVVPEELDEPEDELLVVLDAYPEEEAASGFGNCTPKRFRVSFTPDQSRRPSMVASSFVKVSGFGVLLNASWMRFAVSSAARASFAGNVIGGGGGGAGTSPS